MGAPESFLFKHSFAQSLQKQREDMAVRRAFEVKRVTAELLKFAEIKTPEEDPSILSDDTRRDRYEFILKETRAFARGILENRDKMGLSPL